MHPIWNKNKLSVFFSVFVTVVLLPPNSLSAVPAEFQTFALNHPEYAKLFTNYLELQRHQALQSVDADADLDPPSTNHLIPGNNQEDSTSDKKDD